VRVRYKSRLARLQVVGNTLDGLFEDLFGDLTEEEKALLKRNYATVETLSRADRRIERVARDMVEHFNERIRPNGFKAQIVAADRAMAIRYKEELDRLVGTERAMQETFGSTCHGAGRVMSRHQAIKAARGRAIHRELEDKGIYVETAGRETLKEEMPEAYKDVVEVVDVVHNAGISRRVAKLRPMGVIKG